MIAKKNQKTIISIHLETDKDIEIFKDLLDIATDTLAGSDATHFSVVTTSSGAGQIILRGALSAAVSTGVGIQPQFAIGALTATVD